MISAYRAIAFPVAACALMCTLAVAVAVRSGDEQPVAASKVNDPVNVAETAQRVQALAVRARLDQHVAELRATLELTTGAEAPCPDCGAVDARERLRALKARQAELIRERGRVRASMLRRPAPVTISKACLVNPLAKDCW